MRLWRWCRRLLGKYAGICAFSCAWFAALGLVFLLIGRRTDALGVCIVGLYAGLLALIGWPERRRKQDKWAPD
jgi:hypothetical protein